MKKIYLSKVQQFSEVSYTGSVDPRKLVRLVDQSIEVGQVQDDQRPLDKRHILDIAEHVGVSRGVLPTSIIVGTKDKTKLTVETEESVSKGMLYYMMFPDTEEELKKYANTIDISDGQHRVFAFSDVYRSQDLKDSDIYEVPVTFYITPQLSTRQNLFYTTNAKQKSVSANLLLWLRDQLNLLSNEEKNYLPLIRKLNSENMSPLKNRVIISAERISKGYKAKELVKIFNKAKLTEISTITAQNIDDNKLARIISDYLSGWERKYQLDFQHPGQETMTKISGLRYIFLLLPTFIEISINNRRKFDADFVGEIIAELEFAKDISSEDGINLFTDPKSNLSFRGEGATVKMAEDDSKKLKAYIANKKSSGFNPFA